MKLTKDSQEIDWLRYALEESVALQSHQARLLNQYDGGHRLEFANADAWVKRVKEVIEARKKP